MILFIFTAFLKEYLLKPYNMKKLYFVLVLSFFTLLTNAAIHSISVNASAFAPASVNAVCGDTILWYWGQSGSHTTTSTTIPSCATAWNQPIGISSFTFAITVPCAGTYNYACTPHGFTGVLNVTGTCANGVPALSNDPISIAYPSPFSNKITIEFSEADLISIYNVLGEKIQTIALKDGQTKAEISDLDIEEGVYFYSLIKEGIIIETKKIVKN